MTQQINLYQPIFRREKKIFSAIAMLQLAAIALAGLVAIYAYSYWQVQRSAAEVEELVARRDALKGDVAELAKGAIKHKSTLLEQEIDRLSAELEERQRVAGALSGGVIGDTRGFGDHLEALARRHIEGAWITALSISNAGRTIGISGTALLPELVPMYIQQLSMEPVFSGASFNVLELERVQEEERPRVNFVLRTSAETP